MAGTFSKDLLSQISTMIANRFGLHFPPERWHELERALLKAALDTNEAELQLLGTTSHLSHLSKRAAQALINQLTVGETYFLRDKKLFNALRKEIFPELIRKRRGVQKYMRIWSAGCCTGEEPYSIAILLREILPDLKDWSITILATDINPVFLRKMESGLYREWSFRDTPSDFRLQYFTVTEQGLYRIDPEIQKMVTSEYLNLADDSYPSLFNNTNAMDLIICRNVMIYFVPEMIRKITEGFNKSLADGGYLVVGPSEVPSISLQGFTDVLLAGTILYRKVEGDRGVRPDYQPEPELSLLMPGNSLLAKDFQDDPAEINLQQEFVSVAAKPQEAGSEKNPFRDAERLCGDGLYHEALTVLEKSTQPGSRDPKVFGLMARIYANLGYLDKALTWCQKAIDADKMNPALHYFQAIILQEQKHFEESVISLRSAIYLDPKHILAHAALGNILAKVGKTADSNKSYRNAMQYLTILDPESVLPESDGITVKHFIDHLKHMMQIHKLNQFKTPS